MAFTCNKAHKKSKSAGFSIIEMGVVVSVMALGIVAVMGGQFLIEQARLRAVMQEVKDIKDAVSEFENQLDALPGDMNYAELYWNGATASGDGDGDIEDDNTDPMANEAARVWQHLQLLDLIRGDYPGYEANGYMVPGEIIPPSKAADGSGGYLIRTMNLFGCDACVDSGVNYIVLGGYCEGCWMGVGRVLFEPVEAYLLDNKLDDGIPTTGKIWSMPALYQDNTVSTCTNGVFDETDTYKLEMTSAECIMGFALDVGE